MRFTLAGLGGAAAAVAGACTVAGFLGSLHWSLDLLAHFRLQYAVALASAAGMFALLRRFRAAAACGVFALVNAALVVPLYFGRPPAPPPDAPRLKFLLINVLTENQNYEAVRKIIREEDADVVAVEEINETWVRELAGLAARYPHRAVHPRQDNFGIALYSRVPGTAGEIIQLGEAGVESVAARVPLGGQTLHLLFTHPVPPVNGRNARWRNEQLEAVGQWVKAQPPTVMVLGDLNTTPWSPYFEKLLAEGGLSDSAKGFGLQPTWPANLPFLIIPIDHCLLGPGLVATERRIGPDIGSDHYPLIITVAAAAMPAK